MAEAGTIKAQSALSSALDLIRETTTQLNDKAEVLMDKLTPVRLRTPQPEEVEKSKKEVPASEVVAYAIEQNKRLNGVVCKIQQLIDEIQV